MISHTRPGSPTATAMQTSLHQIALHINNVEFASVRSPLLHLGGNGSSLVVETSSVAITLALSLVLISPITTSVELVTVHGDPSGTRDVWVSDGKQARL